MMMFFPRLLLTIVGILASSSVPTSLNAGPSIPNYLGSESCAECHQGITRAWEQSHHALAWTLPDKKTVFGDFDDAMFQHEGMTARFVSNEQNFYVETEGAGGSQTRFQVEGVVGIAPLQQYLVATEAGRFQALDVAWDIGRARWYHLYPDQDLNPGDGLHWTGPYKTWNARCAECHATGFEKNYDPRTHRFKSTQAEIGVGCEACHGPGEAHVAWAEGREIDAEQQPDLSENGFTIDFVKDSPKTEIQQCAGCHARREPLQDGNPLPGTNFHDAYRLALLRDGLYHADGSIDDEVYVYGSFLQSKMFAKGVRCSDCHDPHGAGLKARGNALCGQCHSPAGNPRFPSLRQAAYDDPSHHFHDQGTESAQCTSCHMIERTYMGIDGRRDHSFRIPRPDLTEETGAPSACIDCHADRDPSWAAAEITRRYPNSERRGPHFSQTFAVARNDPTAVDDQLLKIAEDGETPGIVRATALDLLRPITSSGIATRVVPLLDDGDLLVRLAAVPMQRGAEEADRIRRLVPVLDDPRQAIRIAAARALLDADLADLPGDVADGVQAAMGEWQASLIAKADFPETHMVIGGAALVQRNPNAAEQAFREAVRLDPQAVDAWTMIARILTATGNPDGARGALDEGLRANPSNDRLRSLREELEAAMAR